MSDGSNAAETELKALRAQQAEAAARRSTVQEAAEQQRELARARRGIADEGKLAALIEEHGALGVKIQAVETEDGIVVVKRPSTLKFRRFQDKGSFSYDDIAALVKPCVLHPDSATYELLLEEQPAVLARLANAVVALAGHRLESVAVK